MPQLQGTDNVLLTDDIIIEEGLRLLINELVATKLVNRSTERYFDKKKGDTVSVKKPFRVKSAEGRTLVVQPMVDQTVPFEINRHRHVSLKFNMIDRKLSIKQFSERYLKSAVVQLAHQVDLSVLECAVQGFFHATGTPGAGTTFETMIDAAASSRLVGVPDDGMNCYCLNPLDAASHRKALTNIANEAMVKAAIERAYLGRMANMDGFETAQMPAHTVGALGGTPLVDGASQTGSTLNVKGGSNSITGWIKKGDIFTIDGVYSINPQTYLSTGQLQQFVATADADTDGTGDIAISISPEINDGTLTTLDADGNSISLAAFQNVTAAPADDAPVNVLGTAGTTYRQNIALHKDAITLAMVDLVLPQTAVVKKRARDEQSGMSMTMTAAFDIGAYEESYRLDVLWGVHSLYPELGRRVFGTPAP